MISISDMWLFTIQCIVLVLGGNGHVLSRELGTCAAPGMSYTIPRASSQSNTTELSVDLLTEQVFNSHLFKKMKHHSTSIPPLFPPHTHTSQHHQANSTQVPSISTPGPGGQGVNSSPQSRSPSLSFAGSESDSASGINRPPEERVEGISSSCQLLLPLWLLARTNRLPRASPGHW